jgi:transposase InsO family protein
MMCRLLEVGRSSYYAWRSRSESRRTREDRRLVVEIELAHRASGRVYGSPRVHRELRASGIRCGCKRVARLMREHGIRAKQARRFRPTTDSNHGEPVAANLLDRRFEVAAPDRVWACTWRQCWTCIRAVWWVGQ